MTVTVRLRDREALAAHVRRHFSTQRRFASHLGVSATMVNNLVRGRRDTASLEHAQRMEAALDLAHGTLFVLDGTQRDVIASYLGAASTVDDEEPAPTERGVEVIAA